MDWNALDRGEIRRRLACRGAPREAPQSPPGHCYREAGVLAPLVREDDAWHLLFIRRSRREGDRHSGQVAFAGGKRESGDADIRATALREAREELGIEAEWLEVFGSLPACFSGSGFCITAHVAHLPWPCRLNPDPREVDRVFTMPLDWLADPANAFSEPWRQEDGTLVPVIHYRPWQGERLWGVTAYMVEMLLQALDPGRGGSYRL